MNCVTISPAHNAPLARFIVSILVVFSMVCGQRIEAAELQLPRYPLANLSQGAMCEAETLDAKLHQGSAFTLSPDGTINLGLSPPEYRNCGAVVINGGVSGPNPISFLQWDWGDGAVTQSWFPAFHAYQTNGEFTVIVRAISNICETEVAQVIVNISNAGEPGCPSDRPQCTYLNPYNFHLTNGATGSEPLTAKDHEGNPVTGDLTVFGYDASLISVSSSGEVTALRQEAPNEIGTWAFARVDDKPVANGSVVRVLSQNYGIPFTQVQTANTVLHYPTSAPNFAGDLPQFVQDHEIGTVNEYAYQIERELLPSLNFLDGCRQVFAVDFGEGEASRVCGLSGNPVRLGWNITGEPFQNCFSGPHWFVFYHELGHNITFESPTFGQVFGGRIDYTEGMASIPSLAVLQRILSYPGMYPLGQSAVDSLQNEFDSVVNLFQNSYDDWIAGGAVFEQLDANILDHIWLRHQNSTEYARRFHRPMDSDVAIQQCPVWSEAVQLGDIGAYTYFAALVSAAANEDLSATFTDVYHFPLDLDYFNLAFDQMLDLVNGEFFGSGFENNQQGVRAVFSPKR